MLFRSELGWSQSWSFSRRAECCHRFLESCWGCHRELYGEEARDEVWELGQERKWRGVAPLSPTSSHDEQDGELGLLRSSGVRTDAHL